MSYFCDNVCKISNNLEITGKLYFVSIYINTKEEESADKTITIHIYLNAVAINREGNTSKASANISGTSNTTTDFTATNNVASVGLDGLVGRDGGIFCNPLPPATINYFTRAGYFLESGATVASNYGYALFNVDPRVEYIG